MKKLILIMIGGAFFVSCKTKKVMTDETATSAERAGEMLSNTKKTASTLHAGLIEKHYNLSKDFNTLQINAAIQHSDLDMELDGDVRIEKGKQILINVRKFGFTAAKILIKPDRVSFYEKLNGTHYDGDFDFLNRFLGTDLDYQKAENLLLGTALFQLQSDDFLEDTGNTYKLKDEKEAFSVSYIFNQSMQLMQEILAQHNTTHRLVVDYKAYQIKDKIEVPKEINIKIMQKKDMNLNVVYKKVTVNERLSFPYEIPKNSESIKF